MAEHLWTAADEARNIKRPADPVSCRKPILNVDRKNKVLKGFVRRKNWHRASRHIGVDIEHTWILRTKNGTNIFKV